MVAYTVIYKLASSGFYFNYHIASLKHKSFQLYLHLCVLCVCVGMGDESLMNYMTAFLYISDSVLHIGQSNSVE